MPAAEPFIEMVPVNFDELAKKYEGSREKILGAILRSLRASGNLLTPRIKEETPRGATGRLKNYTVYQVLGQAEDMRMEIRQSAFSLGGFPYGAAVRTGTRPHFPPVEALVPWVIAKLHVGPDRARQVAFLVARKISRFGTKPNPYHMRAWEQSKDEVIEIMKKEYVQALYEVHDVPEVSL